MKSKKVLYIVIVILLLIATATGFFFIGRASNKTPTQKANEDYEKKEKSHKTYTLNETITTNLYEIKFTGFYLQDYMCATTNSYKGGHDDFLRKPTQHGENDYTFSSKRANDGQIFATIEYEIKNITKEPILLGELEALNKFSLLYDDDFNFTDNSSTTEKDTLTNIYVQKTRTGDSGELYYFWTDNPTYYKLNPLSDALKIREYIKIDDTILKDNKPITIKKDFRTAIYDDDFHTYDKEPIFVKVTISEE